MTLLVRILSPTKIVGVGSSCALQNYPDVTEMITTYEIYLREKNVAENCQADSNQRKCQTQVCENFQGLLVCLRDINMTKKK